ncbi:MAG: helix-turn-helix domain-containing protein [Oscillatoriaceae bacterium SKW80]|nr:helix-turn-helix domain-containing protein [Oscillatoriaceae bacterium SKYG93]MCX8120939.1 helix-turn-helix domain-containing protein [Oscillatoriaceae bacterium SKW80]MDW8452212.1 transposase [Oscillatoriaceae cyanobacterium SKYGB_i_bin93]HIK26547.1 helix-turn-helix domain-containing protein [Oscillatoriaceae cyanobacterium M7585_C2015_266]
MESRYSYRFYPTNQQKLLLAKLYRCARWVWNEALAYCQEMGKYIRSVALQQALRNLDRAYNNFFKGKGAPRFKQKSNRQSVNLTSSGFSLRGKKVYLVKVGEVKPIWIRATLSDGTKVYSPNYAPLYQRIAQLIVPTVAITGAMQI